MELVREPRPVTGLVRVQRLQSLDLRDVPEQQFSRRGRLVRDRKSKSDGLGPQNTWREVLPMGLPPQKEGGGT